MSERAKGVGMSKGMMIRCATVWWIGCVVVMVLLCASQRWANRQLDYGYCRPTRIVQRGELYFVQRSYPHVGWLDTGFCNLGTLEEARWWRRWTMKLDRDDWMAEHVPEPEKVVEP